MVNLMAMEPLASSNAVCISFAAIAAVIGHPFRAVGLKKFLFVPLNDCCSPSAPGPKWQAIRGRVMGAPSGMVKPKKA